MNVKATKDEMLAMVANWLLNSGGQILEVGCNNASFAKLLEERDVSNYLGIDIQEDLIKQARLDYPQYKFMCADITKNLHLLRRASTFICIQTLDCIVEDLSVLNNIKCGCKVVVSVPNRPYKGRVRWFDLEGWEERFKEYLNIKKVMTIQNPKKPDKIDFLFKATRNDYIDEKTIYVPHHYKFDNMMARMTRRE